MNSYNDRDMAKIATLSMLGFSIALALLIVAVPKLKEQQEINNQQENRIKILENSCQKS